MSHDLRDLLLAAKSGCGGSNNKMAMAMGISPSSVLSYFRDLSIPGFDKIALFAKYASRSEDDVMRVLSQAHRERDERRHAKGGPQMTLSVPRKGGAKAVPAGLLRNTYAMAVG